MPAVWPLHGRNPLWPRLEGEFDADVVVIGAGFAGLIAAIELAEAGRVVVLLEAGRLGANGSAASAGQIAPLFYGARKHPAVITTSLGRQRADRLHRLVAGSGDYLRKRINDHGISCDLRSGLLCVYRTEASLVRAAVSMGEWAEYGGRFEPVQSHQLADYVRSDRYAGGIFLPQGGLVDPARLILGLAGAATLAGAKCFEASAVVGLDRLDQGWVVGTTGGNVRAAQVLVATGSAGLHCWPELAGSFYAAGCSVIASEPSSAAARMLPGGVPVVDRDDLAVFAPAVSVDGRIIISYLSEREPPLATGVPDFVRKRLERAFPDIGLPRFVTWSTGRIPLTSDGLPRLIDAGDGRVAVTGCNGFGLTLGIAAAREAVRHLVGAAPNTLALPISLPRRSHAARVKSLLLNRVILPIANRAGI